MRLCLTFLCVLPLLAWRSVLALDAGLDISQYAHKSWNLREGFPQGAVEAIAQTTDGYLWVGTSSGLFRFDGVRHVLWSRAEHDGAPAGAVRSLLSAHDGSLWIGTPKGLTRSAGGQFTQYQDLAGHNVYALLEDHAGTIWASGVAIPGGAKVCAIRAATVRCDHVEGGVSQLYEDSHRLLWAATGTGLWKWKPDPSRFYSFSGPEPFVTAAIEATPGEILAGTQYGVYRLVGSGLGWLRLPDNEFHGQVRRLLRDHYGAIWIGTNRGLLHVHQGRTDSYGRADGLTAEQVTSLFEDREGSVWVGTTQGLDQFRTYAISTMSQAQGLTANPNATLAGPDGSIWIAAGTNGLNRWKGGDIVDYRFAPTRPSAAQRDYGDFGHPVREILDAGLGKEPICTLGMDSQGHLWAGGDGGHLSVLAGGHFSRRLDLPENYVFAIASDGSGGLWISQRGALLHSSTEQVTERTAWDRFGSRGYAASLLSDPQRGGLWLGFFGGGIAYFKDDQQVTFDDRHDGLGGGQVKSLYFDEQSTLWAGTEGGLSRLKNGRVQTLTMSAGLPCQRIHWVIQDDLRYFWLGTSCGVLRIEAQELDRWASGTIRTVHPRVFDSTDGARAQDIVNDCSPIVTKATDGKLWFSQLDGIGIIDPTHLGTNPVPPPVHVEEIIGDRTHYDVSSSPRLPPLLRDLEIRFSALSLVAPEKVLFRYKLEGHDRNWQDAGTRRQAFYTDLPPGKYRFRVIASNNSGVWNTQGASLDFSIAPAYWQTNWFRALCVAATLAFLALLYWLRVRQLAHEFDMRLEAQVEERTRIARELHDTLLQSFNGLLLRFRTVQRLFSTRPDEAREILGSAIEDAREALSEGRQAVQGLRSPALEQEEFSQAIRALTEELAADPTSRGTVEIRLNTEGTPRPLQPLVRDEMFRITGEALRNAFRHSDARRIEIQLGYDARRFELRVRDDGKGIDPKFLSDEGLPGHFGLPGMRERAQRMGAEFTVWSAPESGTEIAVILPGAKAYGRDSVRPSWIGGRLFAARRDGNS